MGRFFVGAGLFLAAAALAAQESRGAATFEVASVKRSPFSCVACCTASNDAGEEAEFTEAISHRAHRGQSLLSGGGSRPLRGRHMDREARRITSASPSYGACDPGAPLDPCPRVARSHRLADYAWRVIPMVHVNHMNHVNHDACLCSP